MKKKISLIALGCAAALGLAACSSGGNNEGNASGATPLKVETDLSSLSVQEDIAALVPEAVKKDGLLTVGDNIFYAPAEFYLEDGKTASGFDIDLSSALAKVMGLEANVQQAEFDSIFPAIGTNYEMGIASITINDDRLSRFNMIQYFEDGNSWTVAKGNPKGFDPSNPCGKAVGVQTGTYQHEILLAMNDPEASTDDYATAGLCVDNPVSILNQNEQSIVTTKLAGGQADAMFSDTSVANYAAHELQPGKLEIIGEPEEVSGRGITLAHDDAELTEATQAALQYLIDEGYLAKIFASYGIKEGVATEALLNPGA